MQVVVRNWLSCCATLLFAASSCAAYGDLELDGGRDAGSDCPAMLASGFGACMMELGVVWNGRGCHTISGCECSGVDCDALFDSLKDCYFERGRDCFACRPMDAAIARPCGPNEDPGTAYYFDGDECVELTGCECDGDDCDRLFAKNSHCRAAYGVCYE